ncbi:hypothetical protein EEL32_15075 [Brevibacillus laterosporus]|nr:hypothetical protein [Brevibacillus laterosporus]TPG84964.1 hypothetical protein EEL32_15075 [Brevibacillus laterosporus]
MPGARRTRTRRANVDITETTFLPAIIKKLRGLTEKEVHIGAKGDEELAMIAAIHEYGSMKAGIPARSFIGTGKKKSQAAISKLVRAGVNKIVQNHETPEGLHNQIGATGQERTIKNFDKIRTPPLSPRYVVRKKGQKTKLLVQEQALRDSITFVIVAKRRRRR